ncbi:MAG: tetratricopeptide repeat protein [Chloroflexota bacterium]
MYLKTPKRYSVKRRKRHLFSFRRLLLQFVALVLIAGGIYLYREREQFAPVISSQAEDLLAQGGEMISTMTAPTPMPTENPVNVVNRADANWYGGRVEDAIADYEMATGMLPNDVVTHYRYALSLIIDGRYNAALEAAEDAITADPYASNAWAVMTLAQTRTGDPGGAIASGLHALELNENNPRAYAFLSEAYFELDLFQRATDAANTAVELGPESAEAYFARARVQQLIAFDREAAIADYQTAFSLASYWTDAAVAAAELEAIYGDPTIAVGILNEVKDANPDNSAVLGALGNIYYRYVGDPNQAADTLARCVEVNPNNDYCHYIYGRVLIQLEQYGQAAEMLDGAVRLLANNEQVDPYYNYWAGESQIYMGNCPAALGYLRPGYEEAVEVGDDSVAESLQLSIRECGGTIGGVALPTPTPEAATEEPIAPDA